MYKIEIGIFEGAAYEKYSLDDDGEIVKRKRIYNRQFKVLFSHVLPDDEAAEKMRDLVGGKGAAKMSTEQLLQTFTHTVGDPKTLIMGDYHGYRLTKVDAE